MLVYWFVRHKVTEPLYVGRKPAVNINLHQLRRCKTCFSSQQTWRCGHKNRHWWVKSSSLQLEMGKWHPTLKRHRFRQSVIYDPFLILGEPIGFLYVRVHPRSMLRLNAKKYYPNIKIHIYTDVYTIYPTEYPMISHAIPTKPTIKKHPRGSSQGGPDSFRPHVPRHEAASLTMCHRYIHITRLGIFIDVYLVYIYIVFI